MIQAYLVYSVWRTMFQMQQILAIYIPQYDKILQVSLPLLQCVTAAVRPRQAGIAPVTPARFWIPVKQLLFTDLTSAAVSVFMPAAYCKMTGSILNTDSYVTQFSPFRQGCLRSDENPHMLKSCGSLSVEKMQAGWLFLNIKPSMYPYSLSHLTSIGGEKLFPLCRTLTLEGRGNPCSRGKMGGSWSALLCLMHKHTHPFPDIELLTKCAIGSVVLVVLLLR